MGIMELKEISKIYNPGKSSEVKALRGVDVTIEEGEWVSIMGKSGSGKSTLLHIMGLVDRYTAGSYCFDGVCVDKLSQNKVADLRREKVGFVLQDFGLIWNMSVMDNIATPLYIAKEKKNMIRERVIRIARELEIEDLLKKKAKELSGGQCQRVAIARALITEPKVIFADEPTGALDRENAKNIMEIFQKIHARGTTIVMVTHDEEVSHMAGREIVISDGQIA
ncbi:MAG: ABC transporter ATP-binding protein [Eubacterium sp.]|nr:ABC transporter ATP-binding protein [Eubacterium sp.]